MNRPEDPADSRINSIMKVDTTALLNTLKDLETKLSEYHRADEVPAWAGSILPRMEVLEMKSSKLEKKQNQMAGGAPAGSTGSSIQEIQMEGRIFDRIKGELDAQVGSTKLTLESKVSSISLELDRVHKLLQIRPTTSELQKVVLSIQEIKKQVQGNMNELSGAVELIVKDKVVSEMGTIMDKLRGIDTNTAANMKIMMDKMASVSSDMSALRVGVQNGMDMIKFQLDTSGKTIVEHSDLINGIRSDFDVNNEHVNDMFMDVQSAHAGLSTKLGEFQLFMHNEQKSTSYRIDRHDSTIADLKQYNIVSNDEYNKKFEMISDNVHELSSSYILDSEMQKANLADLKELVHVIQDKGEETANELLTLMKGDILTTIAAIDMRATEDRKHLLELEEKVGTLNIRLGKLNKQLGSMQEVLEPLHAQVQVHETKLDDMNKDSKDNFENVNRELSRQMSDLVTVRDEAAVIKTIGLASDQRVKVIQSTMADLLSTTEAFGNRFVEISLRIEREKMDMLKSVQAAEDTLKIAMYEKQAEIEGAVQNIKENLDLMAHSAEHKAQHHIKSPTAKKESSHGAKNRIPGSAHHSVHPASQAMSIDSGATPAQSVEEQLAFAQGHAHFISDLCINFEEVAIRRSEVPPIPNVIIENVIATVQVLTAYIASCSDAESVVTTLRADPGEIVYEDIVSQKRHQKMDVFLREINFLLLENNKQPGQVRLEAREKFINMLRMALDLCISKHEQVVVTGNTRIGRVKIPSCIACDRPLLEKVRQDKYKDPMLANAYEQLHRGNGSAMNFNSRMDGKLENTLSIGEDSLSSFADNGEIRLKITKDGRPKLMEKVVLPAPQRESNSPTFGSNPESNTLNRTSSNRRSEKLNTSMPPPTNSQSAYVLRGGFKMPRPNDLSQSQSVPSL